MNKKEQEFLVQKIRTQYTEREHTQLDELKKLDTKVKKPAKIFSYLFGSAGALIMGVGMSLTMTDREYIDAGNRDRIGRDLYGSYKLSGLQIYAQ